MKTIKISIFLLGIIFIANSCKDKDGDINIFSIDDDKNLGLQVSQQIEADAVTYPLYPETGTNNVKAYSYIRGMVTEILNSGKINYKEEFAWKVKIIKDDATLNAFCTPGGYIYVYTGLIKYLDKKDELMGVMGHEMAHADHRHSTDAMTRQYGYDMLFKIALGKDSSALANVAKGLLTLKYSRGNETEADMSSVEYLSKAASGYSCTGTAGFFEKLIATGNTSSTPQFLSTHPNPDNRVEKIKEKAAEIGCKTADHVPNGEITYTAFKALF